MNRAKRAEQSAQRGRDAMDRYIVDTGSASVISLVADLMMMCETDCEKPQWHDVIAHACAMHDKARQPVNSFKAKA